LNKETAFFLETDWHWAGGTSYSSSEILRKSKHRDKEFPYFGTCCQHTVLCSSLLTQDGGSVSVAL